MLNTTALDNLLLKLTVVKEITTICDNRLKQEMELSIDTRDVTRIEEVIRLRNKVGKELGTLVSSVCNNTQYNLRTTKITVNGYFSEVKIEAPLIIEADTEDSYW